MRPLFLSAMLLGATVVVASDFSAPVGPEIPVSGPTFGSAPNAQATPLLASNGEITLAIWLDQRDQANRFVAARVDNFGNVLDPLGIHFPLHSSVDALVWGGNEFALVGTLGTERIITYLNLDGVITGLRSIDLPAQYSFVATSGSGVNVRLLFAAFDGSGATVTRVINPAGDVVAANGFASQPFGLPFIATGRDSEFIMVTPNSSQRFSRSGQLLSTFNPNLPFSNFAPENMMMAGLPGNGFLIVRQNPAALSTVAYRLDESGVYTGASATIVPAPSNAPYTNNRPAILAESDRYFVLSQLFLGGSDSFVYAAEVKPDLTSSVRQLYDWVGITQGVAIAGQSGHHLAFEVVNRLFSSSGPDLFVQTFTAVDVTDPRPVALSATLQTNTNVAAGANGYAVTWGEIGPDQFTRTFVRRFSLQGLPQDSEPLEVTRQPQDFANPSIPSPGIASNGDVYLILSQGKGRRLSARTGTWIDAAAFDVPFTVASSNGHDALAVSPSLLVRRIPLIGNPLDATPVTIAGGSPHAPAVASNGTDYLVAWSDGTAPPFRLLAMRVRADGTAIDSAPIVLDDTKSAATNPSIAWNGSNYLVAWTTGAQIRATRVTSEGAVLDRDPNTGGIVVESGRQAVDIFSPVVIAADRDFVLFVRRAVNSGTPLRPVTWEVVRFSDANLQSVAALPRTILVQHENDRYGTLGAVFTLRRFVVAYDRVSDPATGRVPRVFVRQFGDLSRHRAVAH